MPFCSCEHSLRLRLAKKEELAFSATKETAFPNVTILQMTPSLIEQEVVGPRRVSCTR